MKIDSNILRCVVEIDSHEHEIDSEIDCAKRIEATWFHRGERFEVLQAWKVSAACRWMERIDVKEDWLLHANGNKAK